MVYYLLKAYLENREMYILTSLIKTSSTRKHDVID